MFQGTFNKYAISSISGTIPAGLFNSIKTNNATNLQNMFYGTFWDYANNSNVATIPANLFNSIDLQSATNLTQMFRQTFSGYAVNSSNNTDINNIWGAANFRGKITAANAANAFYVTFDQMTTLTGNAQTFINTKLGGIIPSARSYAFRGTGVTGLPAGSNWQ